MSKEKTMISIDLEKCTECLACYDVCPDYVISLKDHSGNRELVIKYPEQCCRCGHCISACSSQAINHEKIPLETLEKLQEIDLSSNKIKELLFSRRSIRKYKEEPVPDDLVKQLLESANHAGSGGNIQSEGFIILKNKAILRQLELLLINILWHAGLKFAHGDGLIMEILTKKFGPDLAEQYKSYPVRGIPGTVYLTLPWSWFLLAYSKRILFPSGETVNFLKYPSPACKVCYPLASAFYHHNRTIFTRCVYLATIR